MDAALLTAAPGVAFPGCRVGEVGLFTINPVIPIARKRCLHPVSHTCRLNLECDILVSKPLLSNS
jgi:hypothetical protein